MKQYGLINNDLSMPMCVPARGRPPQRADHHKCRDPLTDTSTMRQPTSISAFPPCCSLLSLLSFMAGTRDGMRPTGGNPSPSLLQVGHGAAYLHEITKLIGSVT